MFRKEPCPAENAPILASRNETPTSGFGSAGTVASGPIVVASYQGYQKKHGGSVGGLARWPSFRSHASYVEILIIYALLHIAIERYVSLNAVLIR